MFLYSFGIETINTFIHSRISLENYTRFQTKTAQKPYPLGRYLPNYMTYKREYPQVLKPAATTIKGSIPKFWNQQLQRTEGAAGVFQNFLDLLLKNHATTT